MARMANRRSDTRARCPQYGAFVVKWISRGTAEMDVSIRQFAREVIDAEAGAAAAVPAAVDEHFERAVRLVLDCPGSVLTSGIGKAGIIARKLSASFSSTGTPSHFLDPAQAVHGDLGSLRRGDLVVILSDSGETDEGLPMLPTPTKLDPPLIPVPPRP